MRNPPLEEPFPAISCYGKPYAAQNRRFNLALSSARRVAKAPRKPNKEKDVGSLEKLNQIFGEDLEKGGEREGVAERIYCADPPKTTEENNRLQAKSGTSERTNPWYEIASCSNSKNEFEGRIRRGKLGRESAATSTPLKRRADVLDISLSPYEFSIDNEQDEAEKTKERRRKARREIKKNVKEEEVKAKTMGGNHEKEKIEEEKKEEEKRRNEKREMKKEVGDGKGNSEGNVGNARKGKRRKKSDEYSEREKREQNSKEIERQGSRKLKQKSKEIERQESKKLEQDGTTPRLNLRSEIQQSLQHAIKMALAPENQVKGTEAPRNCLVECRSKPPRRKRKSHKSDTAQSKTPKPKIPEKITEQLNYPPKKATCASESGTELLTGPGESDSDVPLYKLPKQPKKKEREIKKDMSTSKDTRNAKTYWQLLRECAAGKDPLDIVGWRTTRT